MKGSKSKIIMIILLLIIPYLYSKERYSCSFAKKQRKVYVVTHKDYTIIENLLGAKINYEFYYMIDTNVMPLEVYNIYDSVKLSIYTANKKGNKFKVNTLIQTFNFYHGNDTTVYFNFYNDSIFVACFDDIYNTSFIIKKF